MEMICEFVTRTKNSNCIKINMKILLCMLLIASSNASIEFPNLRTVHHGNGATSYQNVEIEKGLSIPTKTVNHLYIWPEDGIHELQWDFLPAASVVSLLNNYGTDDYFFANSDGESYIKNDVEEMETNNIAYEYDDYGYHYGSEPARKK